MTNGKMPSTSISSLVANFIFSYSRPLVRHSHLTFKISPVNEFHPTMICTGRVSRNSTFFFRPIPSGTLYVSFVMKAISVNGIPKCNSLSTVVDLSFSNFLLRFFVKCSITLLKFMLQICNVLSFSPFLAPHVAIHSSISSATPWSFIFGSPRICFMLSGSRVPSDRPGHP